MIPSCCPWKVVTFFGKELVNLSSISGVIIGRSWTIKFGKVHYLFGKNKNSKCQNTPLLGAWTKMNNSILFPMKSSYIFWWRTCQLVQYYRVSRVFFVLGGLGGPTWPLFFLIWTFGHWVFIQYSLCTTEGLVSAFQNCMTLENLIKI